MSGRSRIEHRNIQPRLRQMKSIPADTLVVQGPAAWGPMNEPTTCTTWDDFQEKFWGLISSMSAYHAVHEVKLAFAGGQRRVIFLRVAHWDGSGDPDSAAKAAAYLLTGPTAPTYGTVTGTVTAAPFALVNGDTIVVSVNGGGNLTATFQCAAAALTNSVDGPFNIVNGTSIQIKVNGGATQTVTFSSADFVNIAAATAAEVALVINKSLAGAYAETTAAGLRVRIKTDRQGTGATLDIQEQGGGPYGADANSILQFPVNSTAGTGDASNHESVSLAEVKTWLEADIAGITVGSSGSFLTIRTNTAGAAGSIQVQAASTADSKMGLDNTLHVGASGAASNTLLVEGLYYGSAGDELSVKVQTSTGGDTTKFDLLIYKSGTTKALEWFMNVTMDSADTSYVVDVVNTKSSRSKYIRLTDQALAGSASQKRPANTATATSLTGGDDGLTSLATADYTGSSTYRTGLYALSAIREGDILICPDDTSTTYQNAAITYCEDVKAGKLIFIPDAPISSDKAGIATHCSSLNDSEARTAVYWPWVKVANPDKAIYGTADTVLVPPSGLLAGRMKKNSVEDPELEMWKQPGNELYGLLDAAVGLETTEVNDPDVQDYVTDYGVNPIVSGLRNIDGKFAVWANDVQGGDPNGNFKSVGEIRGVAYLRKQLEAYLETERTQGMSEDWRANIGYNVEAIVGKWCARGAFESKDASEAFYVNVDVQGVDLNGPLVREEEKFKMIVAVATQRAGRFIEILFTRDRRAVESAIQKTLASTTTA